MTNEEKPLGNHEQYCKRMEDNIFYSTKCLIPKLIKTFPIKKILDVGCANGKFTQYVAKETGSEYVLGIDDSRIMFQDATKLNESRGSVSFAWSDFKTFSSYPNNIGKFDCILFSSVMHEISSYTNEFKEKYTLKPIKETFSQASSLLQSNGYIVVRDFLKPTSRKPGKRLEVQFTSEEVEIAFFKFCRESRFMNAPYFKCISEKFLAMDKGNSIIFYVREDVLLEFLLCYTWGNDSFERESHEKKLIVRKKEWMNFLDANNFILKTFISSTEEYPKYFDELVKINTPGYHYPALTCLMVAQKR